MPHRMVVRVAVFAAFTMTAPGQGGHGIDELGASSMGFFVKAPPRGAYPLSSSVSLFDLGARFLAPTHTDTEPARGEAMGVSAPTEGSSLTASSAAAHWLWSG